MAQKKGNRFFVWIILGLLFVGLLGFGTGGLNGTARTLGTVGDKEISISRYQQALTQQLRAFEAQVGTPITFSQAREFGLDQLVLNQLVAERALDNEASNLGLSVGDERVREEILRVPAFRDLSGNFDREAYRLTLDRVGQTEPEFEASIREEISRTLLQGAVVGGIPAPAPYSQALVQFIGEQRSITWAVVDESALTAPLPGPTDAEIAAFHQENADLFTRPEQRDISYVWLTPDMIQDEVVVDETALQDLYQERIAEFVQPERRLVERLVYVDMTSATDAMSRLNAGEIDFDGLVAERGLELADVDMGDVGLSDLAAAGELVFGAEAGDVVGPANTSLGPALFRMNAVLAAQETSFEEAEPDLRAELAAARARRVIEDAAEGINDLMAGGATLEDLAERTDLQLGQISWDSNTQDGIAAYDAFRTAAADAVTDAFPTLMDLSDGGLFALRLNGLTPPELRPLEDVIEDVRAAWMRAANQTAVLEKAEELTAQVNPLTGFETLGLTPETASNLTRRSFVEGTPPAFMTEVFEMQVGQARAIDNGTDAIIVRLDDIAAPLADDPQTSAELAAIGQQAAGGIAQDLFEAFSAAVQTRTDVAINQVTLNALNANLQ